MYIGLLDHRGERLLGHPPWFQKAWEVAAVAELGDAQLNGAGAGLPVTLAIAVSLGEAIRTTSAMGGAGERLDFQFHQAMCGEADHLAHKSASPVFSSNPRRFIVSSVIVGSLVGVDVSQPNPTEDSR